MDLLWTWSGKCFGYRAEDRLFTYLGKHVGVFDGDEVYGENGSYLGEVRNETRLITQLAKKNSVRGPFTPVAGSFQGCYASYAGFAMYGGYEDFPDPESFE